MVLVVTIELYNHALCMYLHPGQHLCMQ